MLVLSRVVGELISIGDNITVRIVAVNGDTVRFGVEAPPTSMCTGPKSMSASRSNGEKAKVDEHLSQTDAWAHHA